MQLKTAKNNALFEQKISILQLSHNYINQYK